MVVWSHTQRMKTGAFIPVFIARKNRLETSVREALRLPKSERDNPLILSRLRERRWLKKVIKQAEIKNCPHCGGDL
tara:strand:+ start:20905 stop:21132 length:228 start_codon:yes stop_codon:yes gene_type:complete